MDTLEDRIRRRAYEIWEQSGRTGDPEDHWFQAERELTQAPPEAATAAHEILPTDAVAAADSGIR